MKDLIIIKLTYKTGKPFYVNPAYISSMWRQNSTLNHPNDVNKNGEETLITVGNDEGGMRIEETPEQILEMIHDAQSICIAGLSLSSEKYVHDAIDRHVRYHHH